MVLDWGFKMKFPCEIWLKTIRMQRKTMKQHYSIVFYQIDIHENLTQAKIISLRSSYLLFRARRMECD